MKEAVTAEELIARWGLHYKPRLLEMAAEVGALPSTIDASGRVVFATADIAQYESAEGRMSLHGRLDRAKRAHGQLKRARSVHDRRVRDAEVLRAKKRRRGIFAGLTLRRALADAERAEAEAARSVHDITKGKRK